MGAFLGMRGTGDWVTDQRPKNWREVMLHEYPNGQAPLTAIMSKMKSESTDDPEVNWWTKNLAVQAGDITGVYTDAALSSAYASGGVVGDVLYVKLAEAEADEFRSGHQVLLRDTSDPRVDVNAKAVGVVKNGASSYIAAKLLEADDNSPSFDLSDADRVLICGDINPEGGPTPDAVSYDPVKYNNYCGIQRTSLDLTRTAKKTRLRTPDARKEAKREALELHSIQLEKQAFWSIASEGTGANGKPERTPDGVVSIVKKHASDNFDGYTNNTDYSGKTWLQAGEDWLDEQLEQVFRYGSTEKIGFGGSGALLGIQRLVKAYGHFELKATTTSYGIKVVEWVTAFGTLALKTHPLFSYEASNRNMIVIVDPANMIYRYVDDTFFKKDDTERKGGQLGIDGTLEEFLTECSFEFHHPRAFGCLYGVGQDNTL